MKRLVVLLLALVVTVMLCACGSSNEPYTVTRNGIDFLVNSQEKTISDGTHTYDYDFTGDSDSYKITITYPDGSFYWWNQSGFVGNGGWSDDYQADAYVDEDILCEVIVTKAPKSVNGGKITAAILLLIIGVLNIISPKMSWYLSYGWRFRNAEPSDAALAVARIGGVIGSVAGIILLLS